MRWRGQLPRSLSVHGGAWTPKQKMRPCSSWPTCPGEGWVCRPGGRGGRQACTGQHERASLQAAPPQLEPLFHPRRLNPASATTHMPLSCRNADGASFPCRRGMLSQLSASGTAEFEWGEAAPHVDTVIYCTGVGQEARGSTGQGVRQGAPVTLRAGCTPPHHHVGRGGCGGVVVCTQPCTLAHALLSCRVWQGRHGLARRHAARICSAHPPLALATCCWAPQGVSTPCPF